MKSQDIFKIVFDSLMSTLVPKKLCQTKASIFGKKFQIYFFYFKNGQNALRAC
jgi:hypothetical protein